MKKEEFLDSLREIEDRLEGMKTKTFASWIIAMLEVLAEEVFKQ